MKRFGLAVFAATVLAAGSAFALGGPLGPYEGEALQRLKGMSPSGGAFNAALHKEYVALGEEALAESDHPHGRWYTRKGYRAAQGGTVLPTNPNTWFLPPRTRTQAWPESGPTRHTIYGWHPVLLRWLDANRTANPARAARAQAMYDCWVEEEHEDIWTRQIARDPNLNPYQPADIARCRTAFICAILNCNPQRDINFRFDRPRSIATASRADLWPGGPEAGTGASAPSGVAALDALITAMRGGAGSRVILKGHTDAVGSNAYNQRLSERRALFIRNELVKSGIGAGRVTFRGVGETELLVNKPTRDVRNRRVSYTVR